MLLLALVLTAPLLIQGYSNQELIDAIDNAINATTALKTKIDGIVGKSNYELTVLKNQATNALADQVKSQSQVFIISADIIILKNRSIGEEVKSVLRGLSYPDLLPVNNTLMSAMNLSAIDGLTLFGIKERNFDISSTMTEVTEFTGWPNKHSLVDITRYCQSPERSPRDAAPWFHANLVRTKWITTVLLPAVATKPVWTQWAHDLLNSFHRSMILTQVCMGAMGMPSDSRTRKANQQMTMYGEMLEQLIEGERGLGQ